MPSNYVLLERIELNAATASVTFSNIPQSGYTDLKIVISARTDRSGQPVDTLIVKYNGSSTGYSQRAIYGNGSSAASYSSATEQELSWVPGATATANTFSNGEIYIPNYTSANYKSASGDSVSENNATTGYQDMVAGLWSNTAAITSITLSSFTSSNILANSTFSLYGLAAVGTEPTIAPKAVGGSIYTDNTYWYHVFRTTDTFVPQVTLSCDILTVAGGGSGGVGRGGGAGAGGVLYKPSASVTASSYTVTIGAGGAAISSDSAGNTGTDTTITGSGISLTAKGGGGGGGWSNNGGIPGKTGGSGGGSRAIDSGTASGGASNQTAGAGETAYGFAGGNSAAATTTVYGASGGGAGAAGTGNNAWNNGGVGTSAFSSWLSATNAGQNVSGTYYIAGGGGGGAQGGTGGSSTGGSGGGGAGSSASTGFTATPATINTGGGGGGVEGGFGTSGAGGSGIVIIRYAMA